MLSIFGEYFLTFELKSGGEELPVIQYKTSHPHMMTASKMEVWPVEREVSLKMGFP